MFKLTITLKNRDGWLLALVSDGYSSGSKIPKVVTDVSFPSVCVDSDLP